ARATPLAGAAIRQVAASLATANVGSFHASPSCRGIPSDEQWRQLLEATHAEPLRNRLMLALAYDAGLRLEELCSVRTDDLDPVRRTLRIGAETTKSRRERVIPYSATTGVLLQAYLAERRALSRASRTAATA